MSNNAIFSEWINSELEKMSIVIPVSGSFSGKPVLVIHDNDFEGGTKAPMLFDRGTQNWLLIQIARLQEADEKRTV